MIVGLDYRPAMRARSGIGRYVMELAGALGRAGDDPRLFGVFFKGNTPAVRQVPPRTRLLAWKIPSRVADMAGRIAGLTADRLLGGCDVFHHTNFRITPVARGIPEFLTVHDVAWLREPGCHTERAGRALSRVVQIALDRGVNLLAPSEATAADCREFFGARAQVTPLGVDPSFFDLVSRPADSPPYILCVGTIEPRKNHRRLVEAFARARLDGELRLAGGRGWLCDDVLALAERTDRVRWLGTISESELRRQIAGARAIAYPSLCEGFGLPVLEALAAGKPVLTSDIEPIRSVVGDAALLVDPTDVDAIADGLRRVCGGEGKNVGGRGPAQARPYTWERCAQATREAYAAGIATPDNGGEAA